ncbi:hypothetical protein OROMI_000940 [Orobanche minor]
MTTLPFTQNTYYCSPSPRLLYFQSILSPPKNPTALPIEFSLLQHRVRRQFFSSLVLLVIAAPRRRYLSSPRTRHRFFSSPLLFYVASRLCPKPPELEQMAQNQQIRKPRAIWKDLNVDKMFLESCIHEVSMSGEEGGSLKPQSRKNVANILKTTHNFIVDHKQMQNHWDYLKGKYGAWLKLKNKTGNFYDPSTNTFNMTPEEWALDIEGYMVFECNHNCHCIRSCKNRILQNRVQVQLEVYKTEEKCLDQPSGVGDKKILREVARLLSLEEVARLPKRAIQISYTLERLAGITRKDFEVIMEEHRGNF